HGIRRGNRVERTDHAKDGAEQSQQGSQRGNAIEEPQVTTQAVRYPLSLVNNRLLDLHRGPPPLLHRSRKNLRDRASILLAELECGLPIELSLSQLLNEEPHEWSGNHAPAAQTDGALKDE